MTYWKKIAAYIILLTFVVYTGGTLVYALTTGEIRGRFGWWSSFEHSPLSFLFNFIMHMMGLAFSLFALHMLYFKEQTFVAIMKRARRISDEMKRLSQKKR